MEKDQERRRLSDELPDTELVSMETDKNGKTFEQRQTTHEGRKVGVCKNEFFEKKYIFAHFPTFQM